MENIFFGKHILWENYFMENIFFGKLFCIFWEIYFLKKVFFAQNICIFWESIFWGKVFFALYFLLESSHLFRNSNNPDVCTWIEADDCVHTNWN